MLDRRHVRGSLLAAVLPWAASACSLSDTGVVELNWVVVDRDGDAIFPAGQFMASGDTCDLTARSGGGRVSYDLQVRLEICDETCAGGCEDSDCHVIPTETYPCSVARASERDVPASSDPYLFTVRAIVAGPGDDCVAPAPTCVATPGPRERRVQRGLVTDLQVFEIVLDTDIDADDPLDLEACGCV